MSVRNLTIVTSLALALGAAFFSASWLVDRPVPFLALSFILAASGAAVSTLVLRRVAAFFKGGISPGRGAARTGLKDVDAELEKVSRRLGKDEDFITGVLEALPCAVLELDLSGRIISINQEASRLTGYSGYELAGRGFSELITGKRGAGPGAFQDLLNGLSEKRPVKGMEAEAVFKGGRTGLLRISAVSSISGARTFHLLCMDTEPEKRLLEELETVRKEAGEASQRLEKTISDLEDFALMAVRRELKMQEIRERFNRLKTTGEDA